MKVKALKSFAGQNISMYEGEVGEIENKELLQDLLHAGYVEVEAQEAELVEKPAAEKKKKKK